MPVTIQIINDTMYSLYQMVLGTPIDRYFPPIILPGPVNVVVNVPDVGLVDIVFGYYGQRDNLGFGCECRVDDGQVFDIRVTNQPGNDIAGYRATGQVQGPYNAACSFGPIR